MFTVSSVNDDLTAGIRSGKLPALAPNKSIYEAKVKRDLLRVGFRPPSVKQVAYASDENQGRKRLMKKKISCKLSNRTTQKYTQREE